MTAVWDNFIGPLQMTNRYHIKKTLVKNKKKRLSLTASGLINPKLFIELPLFR